MLNRNKTEDKETMKNVRMIIEETDLGVSVVREPFDEKASKTSITRLAVTLG